MPEFAVSSPVVIRKRFLRSINIRDDVTSIETVGTYIVTPEIQELAESVVSSLNDPQGTRAWALTGPYGSGKSSFALFLKDVLCAESPVHIRTPEVRTNTRWRRRLCPVIVIGHRGNFLSALVRAVAEAIGKLDPLSAAHLRQQTYTSTADKVAELIDVAISVVKGRGYTGLFVVVDEFGKFLEHAALHPHDEELIALQYLAEEADRHPGELLLMTLLHSAFADYVPEGNRLIRNEWQKIQGRFRDIAFTTSLNQHLTLLRAAIETYFTPGLRRRYDKMVDEALSLGEMRLVKGSETYHELLRGCVPLHPFTALLTWPIFRSKMAQNERSLFSFLSSHEFQGFSWFVERQDWTARDLPVYRVSDLFDYVVNALGSAIAFGEFSSGWSETVDTLQRLDGSAPELTHNVVKTIGLLNMYGRVVGLNATRDVLRTAVGNPPEVDAALEYLEQKRLIVFRRYSGSYRLWEGSDVDLDAEYERVKHLLPVRGLAERLRGLIQLRPIVARKHYIEKGTLRTFDVQVVDGDPTTLRQLIESGPPDHADGLVAYVLSPSEAERQNLVELARSLTANATGKRQLVVLGFPEHVTGLERAVRELETWVWIRDNDVRIQSDRVARRELKARIHHFERKVGHLAGRLLGLRGYRHDPQASVWVNCGEQIPFSSGKEFSQWLSQLCDKVFVCSPVIPNELINRRYLSSAAVAARRNLMEAMLNRPSEPNLGFTGGAAETTMYHAILAKSGLHRTTDDGTAYFAEPNEEWLPVWQAIEEFLDGATLERKPVTALYQHLSEPPFGLRPGVIPVLLLAFMIQRRHEVALYEQDVYVPGLRIEVLERLTRRPEEFSIRSLKLGPDRAAILKALANIPLFASHKSQRNGDDSEQLLAIAEPLVKFIASLKPYARSTRQFNNPRVADVRLAIQRATDPYALVFEQLPAALGIDPWSPDGAQDYVDSLSNAINELAAAYDQLLWRIENELRAAFALHDLGADLLAQLRQQATAVQRWATEQPIRRFVMELLRGTEADWREGIGRAIMDGISPSHWNDSHVPQFQTRIRLLAGQFMRLRELATEYERSGDSQVIRVSLLDGMFRETYVTTSVASEDEELVDALMNEVRRVLETRLNARTPRGDAVKRAALARALLAEMKGERHE